MLFAGLDGEEFAKQVRAVGRLVAQLPPAPVQPESLQSHGVIAGQKNSNVLLHNGLLKEMLDPDLPQCETGRLANGLAGLLLRHPQLQRLSNRA